MNGQGCERLWNWFGWSRASWVTMPRAFMHAMPDDWQERMSTLLSEWDDAWNWPEEIGVPYVSQRVNGKFRAFPEYILNYRHPNPSDIDACRKEVCKS